MCGSQNFFSLFSGIVSKTQHKLAELSADVELVKGPLALTNESKVTAPKNNPDSSAKKSKLPSKNVLPLCAIRVDKAAIKCPKKN